MNLETYALIGEDALCCALGKVVVAQIGIVAQPTIDNIAGGFGPFKQKIPKMNEVAKHAMPVLMIADGDQVGCVVEQVAAWKPKNTNPRFELRLAVREAEAWVLADHVGFAKFVGISSALLPTDPESILDSKEALLNLIRRSRNSQLRQEMLPDPDSNSKTGFGYNLHLTDFIKNYWQSGRAAERSPSLARAIPRIQALFA